MRSTDPSLVDASGPSHFFHIWLFISGANFWAKYVLVSCCTIWYCIFALTIKRYSGCSCYKYVITVWDGSHNNCYYTKYTHMGILLHTYIICAVSSLTLIFNIRVETVAYWEIPYSISLEKNSILFLLLIFFFFIYLKYNYIISPLPHFPLTSTICPLSNLDPLFLLLFHIHRSNYINTICWIFLLLLICICIRIN